MSIVLKLFASFRENRGEKLIFDFVDGLRSLDLCEKINLDPDEVSILLVNGLFTKENPLLKDGDVVCIFPAAGGG